MGKPDNTIWILHGTTSWPLPKTKAIWARFIHSFYLQNIVWLTQIFLVDIVVGNNYYSWIVYKKMEINGTVLDTIQPLFWCGTVPCNKIS